MKIAIAKTLLEPAGIPWVVMRHDRLIRYIEKQLIGILRHIESIGRAPSPNKSQAIPTKTLMSIFRQYGLGAGAETIQMMWTRHECMGIHLGYTYTMWFTVPGDSKEHRLAIHSRGGG